MLETVAVVVAAVKALETSTPDGHPAAAAQEKSFKLLDDQPEAAAICSRHLR